eukprot:6560719-Prorocentrum_lima.AAC.1
MDGHGWRWAGGKAEGKRPTFKIKKAALKLYDPPRVLLALVTGFRGGTQLVSSPTPFRSERLRNSSNATTKDAAV